MLEFGRAENSWRTLWLGRFFNPLSLGYAVILSVIAILVLPPALCFSLALFLTICAAIVDWQTYRLPDCLTLPTLLLAIYGAPLDPNIRLLGAIGASATIWLIGAVFQQVRGYAGLGFGDVKLAAGCGAIVGAGAIGPLLLISALFALLSILATSLAKGKTVWSSTLKTHPIAFGPFLSLATLLIAFVQQEGLLG